MEHKRFSTPEREFSYFDAQASWGVTKHMGGPAATDELAALCHIGPDKYVLEVGCGTGVTTCRLAKRFGCRVMGVDLSEKMIEWARRRALRKGLLDRVQFQAADAQNLPFEDGLFDAVIRESVTAFPEDKQKAVNEYARATKPGGRVGLNEGTWVHTPAPDDLVEYSYRTMARAKFLTPEGWRALLDMAGLAEVVVRTYKINASGQRLNEMQGLDAQDKLDRLRGIKDFLGLYLRSAAFRRYAKEITPSMRIMRSLFAYLGYGLYVGRKWRAQEKP